MGKTVLVRAVVDIPVDSDKLDSINQARIKAGGQAKTAVDEVTERIGEAFGGLCEIAPDGCMVQAVSL